MRLSYVSIMTSWLVVGSQVKAKWGIASGNLVTVAPWLDPYAYPLCRCINIASAMRTYTHSAMHVRPDGYIPVHHRTGMLPDCLILTIKPEHCTCAHVQSASVTGSYSVIDVNVS